jgi:polysaccharide export outer membrane protein
MIGSISVADLTTIEIEAVIAARLKEKDLIQEPEVLVYISEYQAKPIYVSGAVINPGQFMMSQELTVMDAILLSGGLQFSSDDYALVHRRVSPQGGGTPASMSDASGVPSPGTEVIKVDLRPFKEGRIAEADVPLRRGDVVVVPVRQLSAFFVVGEVIEPRNFAFSPQRQLTASQAISWAGGPTKTAKMSDGMLIRYDKNGERKEMTVDYAAILKGEQDDFPIEENDIIFVPGSKVKTIGQGMLMLTDNMVMQASFRIGRTYQQPDAPPREVR